MRVIEWERRDRVDHRACALVSLQTIETPVSLLKKKKNEINGEAKKNHRPRSLRVRFPRYPQLSTIIVTQIVRHRDWLI